MRPLCLDCKREMTCTKTGATYLETDSESNPSLWSADLYTCRGCGRQILCGFAAVPYMSWYESGFNDEVQRLKNSPDEVLFTGKERSYE